MNSVVIGLDLFGMLVAVVVAMALLSLLSRRLLGLRVAFVRLVLASMVGLAAGVAFEAEFVWDSPAYTPALVPVQLAVLIFSAVAFVVIAELAVPQGTIPSVAQWMPRLRRGGRRTSRYAQISAIVLRHRLLPFRINMGRTEAAAHERRRQAVSVREALEEAGGAFIKLGQMLSTRTDVLPEEFTAEFGKLQQNAAPAPWTDIAAIVESELGAPIATVFERFDEQPIAAASIGQLHRALLTTGEEVAVKVQRPGIISLVQQDVAIMREIAQRASDTAAWAREMGVSELTDSFARICSTNSTTASKRATWRRSKTRSHGIHRPPACGSRIGTRNCAPSGCWSWSSWKGERSATRGRSTA